MVINLLVIQLLRRLFFTELNWMEFSFIYVALFDEMIWMSSIKA